jgi:hypothetical protein
MIPGYRARAGPHDLGPSVGRDHEDQTDVFFRYFLSSGLPLQFLDAWFLMSGSSWRLRGTRQRKMSGAEGTGD